MKKKIKPKKIKAVKAWAVLISKNQIDNGGEFLPIGNGWQFQFPIFPTIKEAKSYVLEDKNVRGKIIPVFITPLSITSKAK